jgi:uracil DNA glycosylase
LPGPDPATVELTPHGLAFAGEPVTPPWSWQALIAELTPDQIQATKTLLAKA